jgi:hypothetical protein
MKKLAIIALAIMVTALAACSKLDVVGTDAARAFGEIPYGNSADGRIEISVNNSAVLEMTFAGYGAEDKISMQFDAEPFITAGLSREYQQENFTNGNSFQFSIVYTSNVPKEADSSAVLSDFMKNNRDAIGYHTALDHYNIDFGNGNMFEWAKDMSTNDKDIVFVLNPEPFINAGVDPNKIEDWTFAKVPTDNGEVDKLLKAFDLK